MKRAVTIIFALAAVVWSASLKAQDGPTCIIKPGTLYLGTVTRTTIHLSWTMAEFVSGNCSWDKAYWLGWRKEGDWNYTTVKLPLTTLSYTISELEPNTRYEVNLEVTDGGVINAVSYNNIGIITTADSYGFKICGVEVTSGNYDDINYLDEVQAGKISYNHATKTLTLDNAHIVSQVSEVDAFENTGNQDMIIKIKGKCLLGTYQQVDYASGMNIGKHTIIEGSGGKDSLFIDVNGQGESPIKAYNNANLTVRGGVYVETGTMSGSGGLIVDQATLQTHKLSSIQSIAFLTLNDVVIAQPAGARFDPGKKAIVTVQGNVAQGIKIGPVQSYGLRIFKTDITNANYQNISAAGGFPGIKSGTVTYDPAKKILTLDNARIEGSHQNAIENEHVDNLTILLKGSNTVAGKSTGITCRVATVIDGNGTGKLNVTSETNPAIYAEGTSLTLRKCEVVAKGNWGISGRPDKPVQLTIEQASVRTQGKGNNASMDALSSLTLTDCVITSPVGAAFDSGLKGVAKDGKLVTAEVVILPTGSSLADLQALGLSLYPNPVEEVLHVQGDAAVRSIHIYNVYGAEVVSAINSAEIHLAHLPAGLYVVRVITEQGSATQRVVKK